LEKIKYRFAREKDNSQIEELFNSSPMRGGVDILYTKNPSFIRANNVKGYKVQTIIAEIDNEIVAVGTRSLSNNYINGKPDVLGYLSDLRISKKRPFKKSFLADFYSAFYDLIGGKEANIHITTILEDNKMAKAALTWRAKHSSIPNYYNAGLINTYFIFPLFKKRTTGKYKIKPYEDRDLESILEFLNKEGSKKQFFPIVSEDYFNDLSEFSVQDFLIAYYGGRIVGIMAKWKQNAFKQVIINSFKNKFKLLKYLPFFPKEKEEIPLVYVSFAAVKNDKADIFKELLAVFYNTHKKEGHVVLALHESNPLNKALTHFIKYTYKSRLYLCDFKSDEELAHALDSRSIHIEAGLL
jgi:hypothetical protein